MGRMGPLDLGDTAERMRAEMEFAGEAVSIAYAFIEAHTHTGWRSMLSSMFLARAAQAMKSCALLSEHGATGDAMSVGRTVVELDIEHAYIMQADTEARWEKYVAFEAASVSKIAQAVSVLHEGAVDQTAVAVIKERAKKAKKLAGSDRNWAGKDAKGGEIDLRVRAHATGRVSQYDLAYRDMCGASHGGFSTLWYITESGSDFPVKILIGYGPPNAKPIAVTLGSMLPLIQTALDVSPYPDVKAKADDLERRYVDTYKDRAASKDANDDEH